MAMIGFRTLRADEIDVRIGQQNKGGISLLLYKDARCDMILLDETIGPMNWKREHNRDNANCVVSIWDADKGEWVSKEDTGTESNTEAEKGLASDSFKRACVNWGIGRELYTSPRIFIGYAALDTAAGKGEIPRVNNSFFVSEIDYDSNRNVSKLTINKTLWGEDKGVVFQWHSKAAEQSKKLSETVKRKTKDSTAEAAKPTQNETEAKCEQCGQTFSETIFKGKTYSAAEIIARSQKAFGKNLCVHCAGLMAQERKRAET